MYSRTLLNGRDYMAIMTLRWKAVPVHPFRDRYLLGALMVAFLWSAPALAQIDTDPTNNTASAQTHCRWPWARPFPTSPG